MTVRAGLKKWLVSLPNGAHKPLTAFALNVRSGAPVKPVFRFVKEVVVFDGTFAFVFHSGRRLHLELFKLPLVDAFWFFHSEVH